MPYRMNVYRGESIILRTAFLVLALACAPLAGAGDSICYGTTSHGKLKDGVRLPLIGENFQSYSDIASLAGRTFVHSKVHDVLVQAYKALEASAPGKIFVYGETGWPSGGQFKPHKTHQNGLSVDFITPVLKDGRSVPLPTSMGNRFGYDIEFNSKGHYDEYRIDYDALAAHLVELHKATRAQGIGIWRVIFDPKLQPYLFDTPHGEYLQRHLAFSTKPSWVRHDEHYHVDFIVDCKPMGN